MTQREGYYDYMMRKYREDGIFKNKTITVEVLNTRIEQLEKRIQELEEEIQNKV